MPTRTLSNYTLHESGFTSGPTTVKYRIHPGIVKAANIRPVRIVIDAAGPHMSTRIMSTRPSPDSTKGQIKQAIIYQIIESLFPRVYQIMKGPAIKYSLG